MFYFSLTRNHKGKNYNNGSRIPAPEQTVVVMQPISGFSNGIMMRTVIATEGADKKTYYHSNCTYIIFKTNIVGSGWATTPTVRWDEHRFQVGSINVICNSIIYLCVRLSMIKKTGSNAMTSVY